mgnify:CR=1 FL=1
MDTRPYLLVGAGRIVPEPLHRVRRGAPPAAEGLERLGEGVPGAVADRELGALVDVHEKLARANINIYASSGVADGRGSYGYVME